MRVIRGSVILTLLTCLHLTLPASSIEPEVQEVCQWEKFEAQCASDEVIEMTEAVYGRMRIGSCVSENLGKLGCFADVLHVADRACSGLHSCSMDVPNKELEATKPCSEVQSYFEGSYTCLKVEGTDHQACRSCDYIKLTSKSGYISSLVTEDTGCGSPDCPWLIEAQPGQKIRVRLLDFARPEISDAGVAGLDMCRVYAVLKEESTRKSVTICGGDQRETEVYTTTGNSLGVRILGKSSNEERMHFLLHYQVLGCSNLDTPSGGSFVREGDRGTLTCSGGETWHLRCNGTHWVGEYSKCSTEESAPDGGIKINFSLGISIVIIVAIAMVIGALILVVGLVCFKGRRGGPTSRAGDSGPPCALPEEPPYDFHMRQPPPLEVAYREPRPGDLTSYPAGYDTKIMTGPGMNSVGPGHKTYAEIKNEYTHIWEMPLPQPKPEPVHPES